MDRITAVLRCALLALAMLALIPIVIHLWCGLLDWGGSSFRNWELFNIGNDY